MIFVTVGTQLPFERLVVAVDEWAGSHPEVKVFMQTGNTKSQPRNADFAAFTAPEQWEALFTEADLVVSHAGMGTVLKSLDFGKPLIIMPRLASLGEHRNDHQVATAQRFDHFANIRVVNSEDELLSAMSSPPSGGSRGNTLLNENLACLIRELRLLTGLETT